MERVFIHYRLKPGVPLDQYIAYSRNVDQVVTASQPGVLSFEVHLVDSEHAPDERDPSVHVMETIDVASWDAWNAVMASDAMADVRAGFSEVAESESVASWRAHVI